MAIFRGSGSSLTGSAIDPTEALLDSDFTVNGILIRTASGVYSTTPDNTANWDTAYSWGDWAVGVDKAFVDGLNVDADTLDSQEGSWYQDRTNHTGTQTLSTISDSGTAAAADLTTSLTDTTSGRATKVGDFGLGRETAVSQSDFNTIAATGFYRTSTTSQPEVPTGGGHALVISHRFNSVSSRHQIGFQASNEEIYYRRGDNPWSFLYRNRNILGTVSQSSGVPTGAIIEQGSNSNGEYTKFADGTIDMWGVENVTLSTSSSSFSDTLTLPVSINATAGEELGLAGVLSALGSWGSGSDRRSFWSVRAISDTSFDLVGFNDAGSNWAGTSGSVYWSVRGRWF